MSDMLEELLEAEKKAAALVAEAEAEANRLISEARGEFHRASTELLRGEAAAAARAEEEERARIASEREKKNRDYRESLARLPVDHDAFARAALHFIEKGSS